MYMYGCIPALVKEQQFETFAFLWAKLLVETQLHTEQELLLQFGLTTVPTKLPHSAASSLFQGSLKEENNEKINNKSFG